MEYKIPQNIEVEDRVVGPLTLRQFFILMVGAGLVVILNLMFPAEIKPLFYMIAIVLVAATLALAFFDYGGQHIEQIVFSALASFASPRKRVWEKEPPKPEAAQKAVAEEIATIPTVAPKEDIMLARQHIADIARNVDATSKGTDPNDLFQKPEKDNPLEALIKKTKPAAPKEPVVAQLASVSPNKQFEYPQIETATQNPLENIKSQK